MSIDKKCFIKTLAEEYPEFHQDKNPKGIFINRMCYICTGYSKECSYRQDTARRKQEYEAKLAEYEKFNKYKNRIKKRVSGN